VIAAYLTGALRRGFSAISVIVESAHFIYLYIHNDNSPVNIIIEYTFIRSANPKYVSDNMFINIAPANNDTKVHDEITPNYLYSFVLKKPIINNIIATIVKTTTKIVTNICILS
jgi:hypothetical protein